jgi:hypothetical protein
LDAKSTLFRTKEMLSSMLQTSFEFLQHAEAGAEGRLPCVLKKLGGASLQLGQVFRDWSPPTVNITHREPIFQVQRPTVRDHKFAKTHSLLLEIVTMMEGCIIGWVGDMLLPDFLNVSRRWVFWVVL